MAIGKLDTRILGQTIVRERRKSARFLVRSKVIVTASQGKSWKAAIGDLSTHGCNLIGVHDTLRAGNFIAIALECGDAVQAVVRWRRDDVAGAEFLRPLPAENAEWQALLEANWG
jgi:hypothetical protein